MAALGKILAWKISSERFVGHFGMLSCFVAGVGILVIGLNKLATFALTEIEAFFGILLVVSVGLQLIGVGLLLEVLTPKRENPAPPG